MTYNNTEGEDTKGQDSGQGRTENDWVMTRLVSLVLAGWVITVVWCPNGLFIPGISVWLSDVLSCSPLEFSRFVFQFTFLGCTFIGIPFS